ncbi:MAG: hypothetical protein J7545_01070 [Roseofilum sp. SBFL]|uniref:hypothetical protein n=1 Tax=unclassified Roseofilum TaxID=2620099 RepID=UPI001B239730|nr:MULTISPECIES: hypothetical protein [unclassified Roseofilum]MBP0014848.1 hypothetical protein [Roseofilum sp. SID3]MBP0023125.1 hypothetical protein [Roseofilum sp. SID2]MBP0036637.1 hypothetical protein [Roseofilum sp. SID1]MBP0040559.1 hypothetical protein [Roseofilum sp. SBFL]
MNMKSSSPVYWLFVFSLLGAFILWILRGIGLLTFIPGAIIILLIWTAIAAGILQLSITRF